MEGKEPEARVGLIEEVLLTPRLLKLDILGGADNGLEVILLQLNYNAEMIIHQMTSLQIIESESVLPLPILQSTQLLSYYDSAGQSSNEFNAWCLCLDFLCSIVIYFWILGVFCFPHY